MAPTDKMPAPFRWEFAPVQAPRDKAVHWVWRAYSQAGKVVNQSSTTFETREDCVENATQHGYSP